MTREMNADEMPMHADKPCLEHLVAPLEPASFWDEHWAPGRPFLSRPNADLVSLVTAVPGLADAETFLSRHTGDVSLFGPNAFRSTVPAQRALAFLYAGYNLYITGVDQTVPAAKAVFADVARDLGVPPWQVHLEAFAGEPGGVSSRHYDHDINFQILLDGRKEWTLENNRHIRNPLAPFHPTRSRDGTIAGFTEEAYATDRDVLFVFDGSRSERFVADAGTVLFVPRGYWHETRSITKTWGVNLVIKGVSWGSAIGTALADILNQHDDRFRAFCNGMPYGDRAECRGEGEQSEAFEAAKRTAVEKLAAMSIDDVRLSQMGQEEYSWTRAAAQREVVEREGTWFLIVPGVLEHPLELSAERATIMRKLCAFRYVFSWKHARYSPPDVRAVVLCRVLADLIGRGLLNKV